MMVEPELLLETHFFSLPGRFPRLPAFRLHAIVLALVPGAPLEKYAAVTTGDFFHGGSSNGYAIIWLDSSRN
jgi:hypothetical protein